MGWEFCAYYAEIQLRIAREVFLQPGSLQPPRVNHVRSRTRENETFLGFNCTARCLTCIRHPS